MILVDTSVWIDFLKGTLDNSSFFTKLIENREALVLECIFGELLQGAKGKREKEIITEYWEMLPSIPMDGLWIQAGIYSRENRLHSQSIGLIDVVIITAAIKTHSKLWTFDKKILTYLKNGQGVFDELPRGFQ